MANDANTDKWYFSKEQLENTASRKAGYDNFKELSYRQQTANFIQDMGQRLKVTQLCINTAIVYMHRFYVFHSFTNFPWHQMAAAALFLAAKVEEQPRKLEYVIRIANMCRNSRDSNIDVTSEKYIAQSQDLVFNENVLLQTLGFDVAIDHPHTHVVRCCHLVRASKDLAQSSYFLASNSLHLTTMCLQYKPTVVACFCIHLACKWSRWEIPLSTEKKEWFLYVDPTVTAELLQQLTAEFLTIFENCPSRLKEKVMTISDSALHTNTITNSPFDTEPKRTGSDPKEHHPHRTHESKTGSEGDPHKHRSRPHDSSSQQMKDREYREKKEREKLAQQHGMKPLPPPKQGPSSSSHGHHRTLVKPTQPRPPSGHPSSRAEPRDILREAAKDSAFGIATKDYKSDKDVPKQRDYLLKPNVAAPASETNSYSFNGDKPNRPPSRPPDPNKPPTLKRPSYNPNNPLKVSKSPCDVKSVPKPSSQSVKQHHHNGNTIEPPVKQEAKEEEATPAVKKPSLFSPEKSPPDVKPPPPEVKLEANDSLASFLSPLQSPANKRVRNYSTGSEPELRPVMKKIDQVEGFENLRRESSIGINKLHQVPDMITPITDKEIKKEIKKEFSPVSYAKEMKPPDIIPPLLCSEISQPLVNGMETNPMLISSLLKETPTIPHLPVVKETPVQSDHHHHKSKKKNKEKHKHKDKGKGREEKEKKKKHKDREKHKHKEEQPLQTEPIKIKIQKDKIQPPNTLKIKIPKDVIKTELPEQPPVGLKIKIPKDKINEGNRKRERDRNSTGADAPPEKLAKNNRESKQNGRHSYGKVSECSSSAPPAAVYQNLAYQPQNMYYYHQPYMYPGEGQMYNYYNNYMYPTDMYQMPGEPPPLPADAPPDRPPPPPPE